VHKLLCVVERVESAAANEDWGNTIDDFATKQIAHCFDNAIAT